MCLNILVDSLTLGVLILEPRADLVTLGGADLARHSGSLLLLLLLLLRLFNLLREPEESHEWSSVVPDQERGLQSPQSLHHLRVLLVLPSIELDGVLDTLLADGDLCQ